jgi:hypothetical protein
LQKCSRLVHSGGIAVHEYRRHDGGFDAQVNVGRRTSTHRIRWFRRAMPIG